MPGWRNVILGGVVFIIVAIAAVFQPPYFFAKPSKYSLFSALVSDRGVSVERNLTFGAHPRLKLDVYSSAQGTKIANEPIVLFL